MTAEQIRKWSASFEEMSTDEHHTVNQQMAQCQTHSTMALLEVAAQLAELNENLRAGQKSRGWTGEAR